MGISYKNGSGYPDPTAYLAVKNIEADEKILHIQYPSGYMDLKMDAFFPCTVDRARKVFKLVSQYCPKSDKDRLLRFLKNKEKHYQAQKQTFLQQEKCAESHKEKEQYAARVRESERLAQRTRRNIEMFIAREEKS